MDNIPLVTGGFGVTTLRRDGEHWLVQKTLTFKSEQEERVVRAFQHEFEVLSKITHPRLPHLLKGVTDGKRLELTLDFQNGISLQDHVIRGNEKVLPGIAQMLCWIRQLVEAIHFLHAQRPYPVIHRNLNPATVWITETNEEIRLLDFGLLTSLHLGSSVQSTELDFRQNHFSDPTLIEAAWRDPRTDIYSIGKLLFFMLTGEITSDGQWADGNAGTVDTPEASLRQLLFNIAGRCCAQSLESRYPDSASLLEDLDRVDLEDVKVKDNKTRCDCGCLVRSGARFCNSCGRGLSHTVASAVAESDVRFVYEGQSDAGILDSFNNRRFAGLHRFRMMELLEEVESYPGFEELLCLQNLPNVVRMQHQTEAVLRALQQMRGRALLADEVGLGKTIEAGLFFKELILHGLMHKVLIVCPSLPLAAQWQSTLYEKFGELALVFGHDIDTSLAWHCSRLITTYDTLRQPFHVEEMLQHRYDLLILDEAHFLNGEENSDILETVRKLQKNYFLMLSATPMNQSLRELYNIVTMLRPGHFADLSSFEREFMDQSDPMRARNVGRLRELLHQIMIRNRREDVRQDYEFPRRKAFLHRLKLETSAAEFYRQFRQFLITMARQVSNARVLKNVGELAERLCSSPDSLNEQVNVLQRDRQARRILGNENLRRLAEFAIACPDTIVEPKLVAAIEILQKHTVNGDKALVFSQFDETARYFHRRLSQTDLGSRCFLYDPRQSSVQRIATIQRFAEMRGGVLVCPSEAQEGLDLQFASLMINLDLPWNPMRLEQRIGRIQRIGGKKDVFIFNLVLQGTIEEEIYEICDKRIKMFEEIVGLVEEILGNLGEGDDLESLIRDLYLDRRSVTDEGEELTAKENLERALEHAESKSSQESEETLSQIYGSFHFDPTAITDEEDE